MNNRNKVISCTKHSFNRVESIIMPEVKRPLWQQHVGRLYQWKGGTESDSILFWNVFCLVTSSMAQSQTYIQYIHYTDCTRSELLSMMITDGSEWPLETLQFIGHCVGCRAAWCLAWDWPFSPRENSPDQSQQRKGTSISQWANLLLDDIPRYCLYPWGEYDSSPVQRGGNCR